MNDAGVGEGGVAAVCPSLNVLKLDKVLGRKVFWGLYLLAIEGFWDCFFVFDVMQANDSWKGTEFLWSLIKI